MATELVAQGRAVYAVTGASESFHSACGVHIGVYLLNFVLSRYSHVRFQHAAAQTLPVHFPRKIQ